MQKKSVFIFILPAIVIQIDSNTLSQVIPIRLVFSAPVFWNLLCKPVNPFLQGFVTQQFLRNVLDLDTTPLQGPGGSYIIINQTVQLVCIDAEIDKRSHDASRGPVNTGSFLIIVFPNNPDGLIACFLGQMTQIFDKRVDRLG